jgi:hypothetical protein
MRLRSLTAAAAAIAIAVAPVAATAQATVRYDNEGVAVPNWAAVPAFVLAILVVATAIGAINRSRPLPPPPPPVSP